MNGCDLQESQDFDSAVDAGDGKRGSDHRLDLLE